VPVSLHGYGCLIADVGAADGNWRMVEAALERHGPLAILILNAGARAMKPVADHAEEDWDKLMDLMINARADRPVSRARPC
jgi:NADP-dependent 3-hydroxy acid dehydrogenase YdfG